MQHLLQKKSNRNRLFTKLQKKLQQWKLTDKQIAQIENSGRVINFEVYANTSGVVIAKKVNVGDYVSQGASLYDIANLCVFGVIRCLRKRFAIFEYRKYSKLQRSGISVKTFRPPFVLSIR